MKTSRKNNFSKSIWPKKVISKKRFQRGTLKKVNIFNHIGTRGKKPLCGVPIGKITPLAAIVMSQKYCAEICTPLKNL
jgi:hypothetical protein